MPPRPLFRSIWRFNALVIATVGLMMLAYGSLLGTMLLRDFLRPRFVADILPVAGDVAARPQTAAERPRADVRSMSRIEGRDVLWGPLGSQEHVTSGYYSKDATNTRDYLLYELGTGSFRRLIGRDGVLVTQASTVRRDHTAGSPTLALRVAYAAHDTNGDGRLSAQDDQTLALATADGRNLRTLVTDMRSLVAEAIDSDGRLVLIIKSRSGGVRALTVSLDDLAVVSETPYEAPVL
ncbi:MAG: hypothetical protein AB7E80_12170 [Hyphomicrobiaceae bacterium]